MESGYFLKLKLLEKDCSQKELSQLINVSVEQISRIMNSKSIPSYDTLQKLSEILNFTVEEFTDKTGIDYPEEEKDKRVIKFPHIKGRATVLAKEPVRETRIKEEFKELFQDDMKKYIQETARETARETGKNVEIALKNFNEQFGKDYAEIVKSYIDIEDMIVEEEVPLENSLSANITNKIIKYPILSDKSACGFSLIPAEDEVDDWIDLPETYRVDAEIVLQAKGDCLENEKIHDGYLVFIKRQDSCNSGDIVAVRVIENSHGHAILKKLKITKSGSMFLTDKSGDIIEFKENMSIVGKAVYWMPDPRKFI